MQKVVLITGAFGFVGSNLSLYLADKGYELWALDVRDVLAEERRTQSVYKKCFEWNGLDDIPWEEVYAVVHLAGKAHDTKNASDPQSYFDINTGLTQKVLDAFSRISLRKELRPDREDVKTQREECKFILFSSVKAVADRVESVLTEDAAPDPKTPYGQSKLAAEKLVLDTAANNSRTLELPNFRTYVLRPCMIHGPGNKGNLNLLYNIVRKGFPWPLGAFDNRRSFASIENVCAVVSELLDGNIDSGVYQIADDNAISTNHLVELIAESQGRKAKINHLPQGLISMIAKTGDVLHLPLNSERLKKLTGSYIVSNAKIKDALGWDSMPVFSEDGLRKTLESFSEK